MGEIIEKARRYRNAVRKALAAPAAATDMWETTHEEMHTKAIRTIDDEKEFVEFLTGSNTFTLPRLATDPQCLPIIRSYLNYMADQGTPLASLPSEIVESPLVSRTTIVEAEGRPLSTMLLLHLCVALRIKRHMNEAKRVMEIGGGYGNLARIMRLFHPQQQYVILDLLDSLFCSFVFISQHFQDARILFVTEQSQLSQTDGYDFVFVPTEFFDGLKGQSFDLVINTCSLGEMPQSTVDRYMRLINYEAKVGAFYSINRYGPFSATYVMPDMANVSIKLDAGWDITVWDAFGERGFSQIEPFAPSYLEVLAKRCPLPSDDARQKLAALFFDLARTQKPNSSTWHYGMWNAIRTWPSRPHIREYLKIVEPLIFRDCCYYRDLYLTAALSAPELPVDSIPLPLPNPTAMPSSPPQPATTEPPHTPSPSDKEVARLQARLTEMINSKSWRVTKPLRWAAGFAKSLRR